MSGTGFRYTARRSPGVARYARFGQVVLPQRGTPPQAASWYVPLPRPILHRPVRVIGNLILPMDASTCRLILEIGSAFLTTGSARHVTKFGRESNAWAYSRGLHRQ